MALGLRLRLDEGDHVAVAYCRGTLTGDDALEFRSELRKLLPDYPSVVLECGELESMDSAGLGALVAVYTSFRSFGGDIRMAAVSGEVRQILDVCSLGRVFRIFEDEVQAVRSYLPQGASGR